MQHSRHSAIRVQQRHVPRIVTDWLKDYGEAHYDHRGGVVLHFTRSSRMRLKTAIGNQEYARIERFLNRYLVVSADRSRLITVGVRYKPIYN
jgi:hypothetical protein